MKLNQTSKAALAAICCAALFGCASRPLPNVEVLTKAKVPACPTCRTTSAGRDAGECHICGALREMATSGDKYAAELLSK